MSHSYAGVAEATKNFLIYSYYDFDYHNLLSVSKNIRFGSITRLTQFCLPIKIPNPTSSAGKRISVYFLPLEWFK